MCMSLFSHSVIHLCIVCVCVYVCVPTDGVTVPPDTGHEPVRFWEREDRRKMNCSSSTPAISLLLREQFVSWRMRDGARRCTWSWILWSGGDFLIRSCLCPATGVYVIHRRMQKKSMCSRRSRSSRSLICSLICCFHLCKATQRRTLSWSSGSVAGGKMNVSRVMPLGSFLTSPSLPSFQSPTIVLITTTLLKNQL